MVDKKGTFPELQIWDWLQSKGDAFEILDFTSFEILEIVIWSHFLVLQLVFGLARD